MDKSKEGHGIAIAISSEELSRATTNLAVIGIAPQQNAEALHIFG